MSVPPLNIPPAVKTDPSQDIVVVHCATCPNTTTISVVLTGDRSEQHVWSQTAEAAKGQGWAITQSNLRFKAGGGIARDAEWRCPICLARARDSKELYPPFSGAKAACPKCGVRPAKVKYEAAPCEHLRRLCGNCSYQWNEAARRGRWSRLKNWLWENLLV